MTEKQLIEGLRDGDMLSFGEMYRLHRDPLLRYSTLLVGDDHAEDIVQEVFLKVYASRTSFPSIDSPRAYLLRAVHNRCLNYLRDETRRSDFRNQYARNIEMRAAEHSSPDRNEVIRALYTKDTRASLEEAMSFLPKRCREVLQMSYFDGYSHKEIAKMLSISVSTVDNQVYKGLKILRKHLGEEAFALFLALLFI